MGPLFSLIKCQWAKQCCTNIIHNKILQNRIMEKGSCCFMKNVSSNI